MIMRSTMPDDDSSPVGADGEDFGPVDANTPAAGPIMLGDFLPSLLDDVLNGTPPPEYHFTPEPWGTLALRPGEITCVGGPPNCGKTALLMQMVTGALISNPSLKAIVACVEMSEQILIERTLARLSGVYLGKILKRDRDEYFSGRIEEARAQLESLADRLMFIRRPFTMMDVRAAYEQFQPNIVVLDYLQRIPADPTIMETRQQVTFTMSAVRSLADQGPAVLAAAALNRQSSSRNQTRADAVDDNVNDLAAFRDSSDIEYSTDDAYVLAKEAGTTVTVHGEVYQPKKVVLRHVKSRNSLTMHVPLLFDGRVQEFRLRPWSRDVDDGQRVVAPARPTLLRGWGLDNFMEGDDDAQPV
jgi:replicative DNA helicase